MVANGVGKILQNSRLIFFTESYIVDSLQICRSLYLICILYAHLAAADLIANRTEKKKRNIAESGLCHTLYRHVHFVTSSSLFFRANRFIYLTFDPDDNDGVVDDDDDDDDNDYGRKKIIFGMPKMCIKNRRYTT